MFQANVICHLSLEAGDEKDELQHQLEEKVTLSSNDNFSPLFLKRASLISLFDLLQVAAVKEVAKASDGKRSK